VGLREQDVFRLVWLTGGVVAVNEPGPDVKLTAGANGPPICGFRLGDPATLLAALRNEGFSIIGTTFVTCPEERQGLRPPEFRAAGPEPGWLVLDTKNQWRQISFGAGNAANMPLLDIASRIASNLTYSQMRVGDLAKAYSRQLRGSVSAQKPKDYLAFKDMNSFEVYKAIHALFWEMAVLRDRLAEFAASFCLSRPKTTRMSSLRKSLRSEPSGDPLAVQILGATDPLNGWLAKFSSYRDCFTHVAPMEQAANIAYAIQDMRAVSARLTVPQIYYPLPKDVQGLMRRRSEGAPFSSVEELAAASTGRHDRSSEPDALEYLHGCLNQLAGLSRELVKRSPIAPKPIELTKEDIIGEISVSRR